MMGWSMSSARFTRLVDPMAHAIGVSPSHVVGAPVAIDFRWELRTQGVFLSGIPADLVELVEAAHGGAFTTVPAGGGASIVPEVWAGSAPDALGTGPTLAGSDAMDFLSWRTASPALGEGLLERAQRLRSAMAAAVERLSPCLSEEVEIDRLMTSIGQHRQDAKLIMLDFADSRRLVGRYLLDAADELDDERIDQLGDGYVQAASLWEKVSEGVDRSMLWDAVERERICMRWMTGASQPPTRYAF